MAPTSKGKKASKKASEMASEKESAKKSSEKEKASKKTKEGAALAKAQAPELCNEYQVLYDKAFLQKRLPRTRKKLLPPRCFSSSKLVVFGCQVFVEQDSPGTGGG
jgi:hypothetical protein